MSLNYTDVMKPEDIKVAEIWRVLAGMLFKGKSISATQHDEMRRAFYMGFTECLSIVTDLAVNVSEKKACEIILQLAKEVKEFHDDEVSRLMKGFGRQES